MPALGAIGAAGGVALGRGTLASGGVSGVGLALRLHLAGGTPYITQAGLDAGLVPPAPLRDAVVTGGLTQPASITGEVG